MIYVLALKESDAQYRPHAGLMLALMSIVLAYLYSTVGRVVALTRQHIIRNIILHLNVELKGTGYSIIDPWEEVSYLTRIIYDLAEIIIFSTPVFAGLLISYNMSSCYLRVLWGLVSILYIGWFFEKLYLLIKRQYQRLCGAKKTLYGV
mgnify:CR=1 FL=1